MEKPKTRDLLINEDQATKLEPVLNLDDMANTTANWLAEKKAVFNHVANVPDEEEVNIKCYDPTHPDADAEGYIIARGDIRKGFLYGMKFALEHMDTFPYQFLPEDADGNVPPEFQSQEPKQDS